ncbi:alanine racemase [Amphibacillus marinus]|uniref:Alanine racemase n=1 Tax=Amphibacillus marinus TaxID=872970 RepID=A0A1H8JRQ4_9BACI|nr:alanine racemase [Amphibacillus marinus]
MVLGERAWLELNLNHLKHNFKVLQKASGNQTKVMAVVKANGYGHGMIEIAEHLSKAGAEAFAVATIDEAISLRQHNVTGEILILGYTSPARRETIRMYDLTQTIVDHDHAKRLAQGNQPIKVHLKIDTGMHRLGERYDHISEITTIFSYHNLAVTGIYTHLSVSDSLEYRHVDFSNQQIKRFYTIINKLEQTGLSCPPTHIQSSYGLLNYPELSCDIVRIGIALYGVLSTALEPTRSSLALKPVLALKAKVIAVRSVYPGEEVGYGRSYLVKQKMKIATISIGYADGFPRALSNQAAYVLIRGKRVPVIGRVCMDQLTVDVSTLANLQPDEVVTLIGSDGHEVVRAEEVADLAGTITNELLSRLGERLERIYVTEKRVVVV